MTSIVGHPLVPEALREAAARTTLVPFIGAGASKLAGCPNWSEFADGTLQRLIDAGKLSFAQVEQIKHLTPRTRLSIARMIEHQTNANINFKTLFHRTTIDQSPDGLRLFDAILKLGNVIVTTNYDCWLDQPLRPITLVSEGITTKAPLDLRRTIISQPESFLPGLLDGKNTVIHLHGSVDDPRNMIVTTQDYLHHYRNDRRRADGASENRVLTFLEALFERKNVLFIGYGLEELEVLEYVVLKARSDATTTTSAPRHFMLQGFFSYQEDLVRNLSSYYRQSGIELIPFRLELIDVVEDFASQIPAVQPLLLEQFRDMDALLDE
jgi:hypothetical protein